MRMHLFFLSSLFLAAGCNSETREDPDSAVRQASLDFEAAPAIHKPFKSLAFIKCAIGLQSMDKSNAFALLRKLAKKDDDAAKVMVLCRLLFTPKIGEGFRRPGIGEPTFLGGSRMSDWPLEPVVVIDGVPFNIVYGYTLAGEPEDSTAYLEYCIANCVWSEFRYKEQSALQLRRALEALLGSGKWRGRLSDHEKAFLLKQIE